MSDMIIRDPNTMKKFASEIDEYCNAMKGVCIELKSHLSTAVPKMKDEQSKKALKKIEILSTELISGLPEALTAAEKLRKSAKFLEEIQSISI